MKAKVDPLSVVLRSLIYIAAAVVFAVTAFIVVFVLIQGIPNLQPKLFEPVYNSSNSSMFPSLVNTFALTLCSLIIAVPLGVASAIYLSEYAPKSGVSAKLVKVVRLASQTLAGIPSIIYGLVGMLIFVSFLHLGYSLIAGVLTLSIMVLPLIINTAEEALHDVPVSMREGSLALGAGKLRTVFKVVLPVASPGILSGVILGAGRIMGETAALIYTAGTVAQIPSSALDSTRSLAVHMYTLSSEGLHTKEAWATAVVLLIVVFITNSLAAALAGLLNKNKEK